MLSSLFSMPGFWGILIGLAAAVAVNKLLMAKIPATINTMLKTVLIDVLDVLVCAAFVFVFWPTHDIFTAIFAVGVGAAWRYLSTVFAKLWVKISPAL